MLYLLLMCFFVVVGLWFFVCCCGFVVFCLFVCLFQVLPSITRETRNVDIVLLFEPIS